MSNPELEMLAILEDWVIHNIEKTDWTDTSLSEEEKHVIGMAVSSAYHKIAETNPLNISRIEESCKG